MVDLLDLAARVEKAAPDQQAELIGDAWDLLGPMCRWSSQESARFANMIEAGAYESAAMMLVPISCGWFIGWGQTRPDEPMGGARITRNGCFIGYDANYDAISDAEATTPALALTAACLRAHHAMGAPDAA